MKLYKMFMHRVFGFRYFAIPFGGEYVIRRAKYKGTDGKRYADVYGNLICVENTHRHGQPIIELEL